MPEIFQPKITLLDAMTHPTLFGRVFAAPSFWTWRTVAKVIDGVALTEQREIDLFKQCTGRSQLLSSTSEMVLRRFAVLAGRRAGKDRFFSAVAVWRAALCTDWRKYLSPGEQAVVILLGRDKKQAAILRKYCHGLLEVEALQREIRRETADVIEFKNGAVLEIAANDANLVRGRSAIAVIGSECAHWKTDEHSRSSDEEVVGAAEPSMAMCPDGGLLLLGSSVARQRGLMFRLYRELFGNNDSSDICWFAPSRTMNPLLPQRVVDTAMANDPHKANAEFNNIWREDSAECFSLDAVEACIDVGVHERSYVPGTSYTAHVDTALGVAGGASFTLAIAHRDAGTDIAILDLLRERKPPFVFHEVIAEFAQILKAYGISQIWGDHHAFKLFADEWKKHGIVMKESENSTTENYLRALPLVLGRRARLLDNTTLKNQLLSLEIHATDGKEKVECPQNARDDVAVAACCALVAVSKRFAYDKNYFGWSPEADAPPPPTQPQPELLEEIPIYNMGDWWRWKGVPRSQPTYSADQNREVHGPMTSKLPGLKGYKYGPVSCRER